MLLGLEGKLMTTVIFGLAASRAAAQASSGVSRNGQARRAQHDAQSILLRAKAPKRRSDPSSQTMES